MKTLFLKLELADKSNQDNEKEIIESIKKQKSVYNVKKLEIHRCNTPLYTIGE